MISFSEEHLAIRDAVRQFALDRLAPIASEIDEKAYFPIETFRELAQLGFLGAAFPEKYGGGGSDLIANSIIKEELSAVSPGFAMSAGVSAIFFAYNVLELGSEDQRQHYIPNVLSGDKIGCWCLSEPNAGSDALSVATRSEADGDDFIINGTKTFITNGPIADYFLVATRTFGQGIEGGTLFILDKDTPGLTVGAPFKKLGMCCSPTCEVFFEDVRVPASQVVGEVGQGFRGMMSALDTERVTAPFTSIGIARACLEKSRQYARERSQFGRPLSEFQLIQAKLADMAEGIALARQYAYAVVKKKMRGERITFEVAMAKRFAAKMASQSARDAVQIHGGYGFIREYDVERFYRDVKLVEIGGGTNEIQTLIISRELMKGLNP